MTASHHRFMEMYEKSIWSRNCLKVEGVLSLLPVVQKMQNIAAATRTGDSNHRAIDNRDTDIYSCDLLESCRGIVARAPRHEVSQYRGCQQFGTSAYKVGNAILEYLR